MTWYTKYLSVFEKPFSSVPLEIIEEMKEKLRGLNNEQPLASVVVIAHNEETRLLSCLWSLSDMVCKYPVEIIGVNNNSIDKTGDVFEAVGIRREKELRVRPPSRTEPCPWEILYLYRFGYDVPASLCRNACT